jgi:hypothetical protein
MLYFMISNVKFTLLYRSFTLFPAISVIYFSVCFFIMKFIYN